MRELIRIHISNKHAPSFAMYSRDAILAWIFASWQQNGTKKEREKSAKIIYINVIYALVTRFSITISIRNIRPSNWIAYWNVAHVCTYVGVVYWYVKSMMFQFSFSSSLENGSLYLETTLDTVSIPSPLAIYKYVYCVVLWILLFC